MEVSTHTVSLFAWVCISLCLLQASEAVFPLGNSHEEHPVSKDSSSSWFFYPWRSSGESYDEPVIRKFGEGADFHDDGDEQINLLLPTQKLIQSPSSTPPSSPFPTPKPPSPSPPLSPSPSPNPPSLSPTFPPSSISPSPTPYPFSPPPFPTPSSAPASFPSFTPSSASSPTLSPTTSPSPSPSPVSPPSFPPFSPTSSPSSSPSLPPSPTPSPIVPPPFFSPSPTPTPSSIVSPPTLPPSPSPSTSPILPPSPSPSPSSSPILPPSSSPSPSPIFSPSPSPSIFPPSKSPTSSPSPIFSPSPSPSIFPPSQSPSPSPSPSVFPPSQSPSPSPSPSIAPPSQSPSPSPSPSVSPSSSPSPTPSIPSPPGPLPPSPMPAPVSILGNLVISEAELVPQFDPYVFNYRASFGAKARRFHVTAYIPKDDEDYKLSLLYIDNVPLSAGEMSPPLKLGKRGETLTYKIFVKAIGHELSTYVLSISREAGHKGLGPVAIFFVVLACIVGALVLLVLAYGAYVYARTGRIPQLRDLLSRERDNSLYTPLVAVEGSESDAAKRL